MVLVLRITAFMLECYEINIYASLQYRIISSFLRTRVYVVNS